MSLSLKPTKNLSVLEKDKKQQDKETSIDSSIIEYNLSLTYEERLINHQRALDTISELKKAGEKIYGKPIASSQASS